MFTRYFQRLSLVLLLLLPVSRAAAQTLAVTNDIQSVASLASTTATVTGRAELRLTGTGDVLPGSTVNLVAPDSWLIFTQIVPSVVNSTFLSRIRVNGAAAVLDGNVRIVQYGMGTVVIPHAPAFQPLEIYDDRYFRGASRLLSQYTAYNAAALGTMSARASSFKLRRGYMATFAASDDGVSNSRCYVAQDGDLEITRLPAALDNSIRFVRVFPWRWVSKKGIAGNIAGDVKALWWYNWNLDQNSPLDREYAAIKQQRWWPSLNQNWQTREVSHVLGFNEPDNSVEADLTAATAVSLWPELLGTGLRTGSPAPTDGGLSWLYSFVDASDAAGQRVDYVAVHYYRSYGNNNDPAGIANQFYNFLKGIYDRTKRPIWITEWNNGANWTTNADPTAAQQADAVEAMLNMLDSTPFVERYALYNWVEDVRRLVWDDGWPTAAGVIYRDKVSPIGHRQEHRDSDIGRTTRYRFDGTTADDGGNGQDALRVGTPSYTAGRHGQAIALDGVNDYLQVPANVGNSTDFTFAAWVYWNGGANWQRIFDLGDDTNHYLFLTTKAGSAGTRFAISTTGGSGEQRLDAAAFPTGAWTHVAVTLTGTTGKLFINGVLADTGTGISIDPAGVEVKYNYLGHSRFAADPNFNGRLDDVRFLTTALTDAQVAAIVAGTPPSFTSTAFSGAGANIYQPYTASLSTAAAGGTGALTFAKMDGPVWLRVSAAGAVTGTPGSADAGLNTFMLRVTDAAGGAQMAVFTVDVQAAGAVPVTISAAITSGSNDAEESAAGDVTLDSTDIELVHDTAVAGLQTCGLRFSLQVPPGAHVQDARIQFKADEDQDEPTDLTIAIETADNAAVFAATAGSLSSRTLHPVTVPWQPQPWVAGSTGPAQLTPNLAGLVESVVTRPGWQMGNAVSFIITGTGHRTGEAFEKAGAIPARLTLTYVTPSPLFSTASTIAAGADDAEQSAAGAVSLTSTDLELVADGALGNQTVGLRFTPLAVPRDALIASALVQFAADEAQSEATALTIRAQAADTAAGFTNTASDLTSRPRTTAAVAWAPAAWATVGERGPLQLTPDLSPLVQEVISRPGWDTGHALALFITGTGHRTADAFEDTAAQPAQLSVNYYTEIPLFSYGRWAVDFPDLNGSATDDDDGDGGQNFVEYALGSNPVDGTPPPSGQLALTPGELQCTWQQNSAALDTSCTPEWADTPAGPWSTAGIRTVIAGDDGTLRTLRATLSSGAGRRFVRLRIRLL